MKKRPEHAAIGCAKQGIKASSSNSTGQWTFGAAANHGPNPEYAVSVVLPGPFESHGTSQG